MFWLMKIIMWYLSDKWWMMHILQSFEFEVEALSLEKTSWYHEWFYWLVMHIVQDHANDGA